MGRDEVIAIAKKSFAIAKSKGSGLVVGHLDFLASVRAPLASAKYFSIPL